MYNKVNKLKHKLRNIISKIIISKINHNNYDLQAIRLEAFL